MSIPHSLPSIRVVKGIRRYFIHSKRDTGLIDFLYIAKMRKGRGKDQYRRNNMWGVELCSL